MKSIPLLNFEVIDNLNLSKCVKGLLRSYVVVDFTESSDGMHGYSYLVDSSDEQTKVEISKLEPHILHKTRDGYYVYNYSVESAGGVSLILLYVSDTKEKNCSIFDPFDAEDHFNSLKFNEIFDRCKMSIKLGQDRPYNAFQMEVIVDQAFCKEINNTPNKTNIFI